MSNNKIVYQVTKEYMKKNRKRTVTTLFGIIFMVMLMTCVFVGKDTAINYLEELASLERGSWHISVYDVTDEEYEQIKVMEDVEQIGVSSNLDYAMLEQSANVFRPYINIKSYSTDAMELHNIKVAEGRLPQIENEIVINVEAVEDGADIKIGDTINAEMFKRYIGKDADHELTTVFFGGFTVAPGQYLEAPMGFPFWGENDDFYENHEFTGMTATYTVVGFIEKPSFEKKDAAGYTAITYNDGAQIAGSEKNVTIRFDLKRNGDYDTTVENIVGEDNSIEYNSMLLAFSANSKDSTINGVVVFMSVFFVVLIVAASVVLIYNVFNMSFEERTKYLGMLSSVGATGKQKRSSVYYEAFSLLVVGLPMGFAVGLLVVKLGMMALKPHLDTLLGMYSGMVADKVSLEISLIGVVCTVAFSVVTVWISAYLPARKIGKIGPVECIRGSVGKGAKNCSVNTLAIRLFGAEGMLAANSVSREKKKTRGLIAAAAIFMIVLIVTSFATKTLTTIVNYAMSEDGDVNTRMEYDFMASVELGGSGYEEYNKLKETLANDDSVESCVEYFDGMFLGWGNSSIFSKEYMDVYTAIMNAYGIPAEKQSEYIENFQPHVNFIAVDDVTLAEIVESTGADKNIMYDENVNPVIVMQNGEMSTDSKRFPEYGSADFKFFEIDTMIAVNVGESFDVAILNGTTHEYESVPLTVAGHATNKQLEEYFAFHTDEVWVITNEETLQELIEIEVAGDMSDLHSYTKSLFIKFNDKSSQLYRDINDMYHETLNSDIWEGLVVISSVLLDGKTIAGTINVIINILLKCFVALTSVICIMNLYNSTKGRITGRRKELAVLRSMGMTEQQMRKMLLMEAGSVLARSVLVAVLVATPVLVVVSKVLVKMFGRINLGSPVGVYLIAIASTAVALVVITFFTHSREKSKNIMDDIRRESI
ncbi:MAG: ABC transporter permease [Lachnospiraceae bacterium]|nr:ABC transporter permease [Lachnospiraceae bacterium]